MFITLSSPSPTTRCSVHLYFLHEHVRSKKRKEPSFHIPFQFHSANYLNIFRYPESIRACPRTTEQCHGNTKGNPCFVVLLPKNPSNSSTVKSTQNPELKEQNSKPIFLLNFKVYIAWQIVIFKCVLPFYLQQPERQDSTKDVTKYS